MENLFNKLISHFESIYDLVGEEVYLSEVIKRIKNGAYKDKIDTCRKYLNINDLASYKKVKMTLPSVTFSGKFISSRKSSSVYDYSNIIVLDIDSIGTSEIFQLKVNISKDKHVAAIWNSPSGRGFKVMIPVLSSHDDHRLCFDILVAYFQKFYKISIDKSGSDISRLSFYSYDPNILINENTCPFNFNSYLYIIGSNKIVENNKVVTPLQKFDSFYGEREKSLYNNAYNRNRSRDRDTIQSIVRYLKRNELSITAKHHDWYRVALAIANTFTLDIGVKYYLSLCRLDGESHDEYKSKKLLEYCYRIRRREVVKFATIIYLAQMRGYKSKIVCEEPEVRII